MMKGGPYLLDQSQTGNNNLKRNFAIVLKKFHTLYNYENNAFTKILPNTYLSESYNAYKYSQ